MKSKGFFYQVYASEYGAREEFEDVGEALTKAINMKQAGLTPTIELVYDVRSMGEIAVNWGE